MLEEFLAGKITFLDTLLSEFVYNLCLCSNRSMVSSRNPARILAVKTSLTDKDILNSIVEHVSHVKHTSHVWWWDYDRIRFTTIRFATE